MAFTACAVRRFLRRTCVSRCRALTRATFRLSSPTPSHHVARAVGAAWNTGHLTHRAARHRSTSTSFAICFLVHAVRVAHGCRRRLANQRVAPLELPCPRGPRRIASHFSGVISPTRILRRATNRAAVPGRCSSRVDQRFTSRSKCPDAGLAPDVLVVLKQRFCERLSVVPRDLINLISPVAVLPDRGRIRPLVTGPE